MMHRFLGRVSNIFMIGFLASVVYKAKCEVYVDGTKGLKRNSGQGVAYANFAAHKFHYLNISPLLSVSVNEFRECGKLCVDHLLCFSFNGAVFRDMEGKILCELLPSDKYNKSSEFASSQIFHHFSIKTPCSSNPCLNNSTCVAKYERNEYYCACVAGFSGKLCEIDINECSSAPCLNGGSCVDHVNGYTCSCVPGYTGVHCETDMNINECLSSPCLNGGTCVNGVNMFQCNCIAYITGTRCETIVVPDPIAVYPLNAAYTTSDMMGNQPSGFTSNVQLAAGPGGDSQGSYQFWGVSNSYIELPNNGGLDTQYSITLLMWVYREGESGPLFNYSPSGHGGVHLWITSPGQLFCRFVGRSGEWPTNLISHSVVSLGQWSHVGCSYDYSSGIAKAWVDAAEVRTLNIGVFSLGTHYDVRMSAISGDGRYFRGRIARVQVYNIALNLGQVRAAKFRGQS